MAKAFTRWRSNRGAGKSRSAQIAAATDRRVLQSHAQSIAAKHNKPFAIAKAQAHQETRAEVLAREADQRAQQSQDRDRWHEHAMRLDQQARERRRYGSVTRRAYCALSSAKCPMEFQCQGSCGYKQSRKIIRDLASPR